jgi:hypothetical protein
MLTCGLGVTAIVAPYLPGIPALLHSVVVNGLGAPGLPEADTLGALIHRADQRNAWPTSGIANQSLCKL